MTTLVVADTLDDTEREAVDSLLDAAATASGHPALPDAKRAELSGAAPRTGFAVLARDGERLLGYGHALVPNPSGLWYVQAVIDPTGPDAERDGLWTAIAETAVAEAKARAASAVRLWVFDAGPDDDRRVGALGGAPARDLVQMRCDLPHPDAPNLPDDTTLRTFVAGQDEDEWLDVNRAAFGEHPEQGTFSRADLEARMGEPWFDPADFLILDDAHGVAGFCWVKTIHATDGRPGHGEIYVVAAHPRRQGEGLGRALTLAGLARMSEHGLPEARLYVDGGNAAAVSLYESLGFARHHVDRVYEVRG